MATSKSLEKKKLLFYSLLLATLLGACKPPSSAVQTIQMPKVKVVLSETASCVMSTNPAPHIKLTGTNTGKHFYLIHSDDFNVNCHGHINKIAVSLLTTASGTIIRVWVESHRETPQYFSKLTQTSFLQHFTGKNLHNIQEVDTVTGATESSTAVKQAILITYKKFYQTVLPKP